MILNQLASRDICVCGGQRHLKVYRIQIKTPEAEVTSLFTMCNLHTNTVNPVPSKRTTDDESF